MQVAGGRVIETMTSANYILANPPYPNQPWYQSFLKHVETLDPELDPRPTIRPYYWFHACINKNKLLLASETEDQPLFSQKTGSAIHHGKARDRPLRVYLTLNMPFDAGEAHLRREIISDRLERTLLSHGGIRVKKRCLADILILNRETKNYEVYEKEMKRDQSVKSREWFDDIVARKIRYRRGGVGLDDEGDEFRNEYGKKEERKASAGINAVTGRPMRFVSSPSWHLYYIFPYFPTTR